MPLLTVDQAAERLSTKPRFIRRLIAEQRIPYVKLGCPRPHRRPRHRRLHCRRPGDAGQRVHWRLPLSGRSG